MGKALRALLVEDSHDDACIVERALKRGGFDVYARRVETAPEMVAALEQETWDLILSDYIMPRFGAIEALNLLKKTGHDLPFIIVSGKIDEETAVVAMKAGAHDFVTKGNLVRLVPAISRELEEANSRLRRRSSELAHQQSEERYKQLAESITDVFFALDRKLHCTYWNKTIEKLTGIHAKSAIGTHFTELLANRIEQNAEEAFLEALETNTATSFTNQMCNLNDEPCFYEWHLYPSPQGGLVVLGRDITEQQKAEKLRRVHDDMARQLKQARELKMLGRLTSGVAHEVRNPLNAISVVTEALFQEIGENAGLDDYKEHIRTHVGRLTHLMQDLLDLGRPIDRAKLVNLRISELIEGAITLWRSGGPSANCDISIKISPDAADLRIRADQIRMQQVILNLLDNAAQHSPPNSIISVTLTRNENLSHISIIDQGTGIPSELIKQVFDPFFTTRKRGTGLGLSIVQHMVEVHGGTISIRNNDSCGCTVDIMLPAMRPRNANVALPETSDCASHI